MCAPCLLLSNDPDVDPRKNPYIGQASSEPHPWECAQANSLHLAGKPRFFEQSENHLPRDRPAFVSQFSERSSGSSFSKQNWAAGSMSRLDGEVELQTRSLKMDVWLEVRLGLAK